MVGEKSDKQDMSPTNFHIRVPYYKNLKRITSDGII